MSGGNNWQRVKNKETQPPTIRNFQDGSQSRGREEETKRQLATVLFLSFSVCDNEQAKTRGGGVGWSWSFKNNLTSFLIQMRYRMKCVQMQ